MLAAFAAIFMLWVVALPGPAEAAQRRADGLANIDNTEFSAQRRYRRYYRRGYAPRYYYRRYYPRRYYYRPYYRPYYYRPYYYRPYRYWGPRPFFYFGF
jgi:hypothetical protein